MEDDGLEGPRPARKDERDALLETVNYIFRISKDRPPSIATDYPHVYAPDNLSNISIIKSGEKIISSVAVWPCDILVGDARLRVGGINAVGTLPEFRKRGLGSRVMEAAHQRLRDLNCHVGLLSTGIHDWYRGLGWESAGTQRTYRLDRSNIGLLPSLATGIAMHAADQDAHEDILALHHAARLGARRTAHHFGQVLSTKKVSGGVVARKDARVVAYLLSSGHDIVEWGGPAEIVAGLVQAWFQRLDDPNASTSDRENDLLTGIALHAFGAPCPLLSLLDTLRIPYALNHLGMMRIVDPQGILQAFGCTDITLSQHGETFDLKSGDQSDTRTRSELAKLYFGPERISNFADHILPFPFWQWGLERV